MYWLVSNELQQSDRGVPAGTGRWACSRPKSHIYCCIVIRILGMKCWRDRILYCVVAGLLAGACGSARAQPVRTTVDRYCSGCHNAMLKSGGLVLDDAVAGEPPAHPEIWEKVVRR